MAHGGQDGAVQRHLSQQDSELFRSFPDAEADESVRYDLSCCFRESVQALSADQGRLLFTYRRFYFDSAQEGGRKLAFLYSDIKDIRNTGGFIPGILVFLHSQPAPLLFSNFLDRQWPYILFLHFWRGLPFVLPTGSLLTSRLQDATPLPRAVSFDPTLLRREKSREEEKHRHPPPAHGGAAPQASLSPQASTPMEGIDEEGRAGSGVVEDTSSVHSQTASDTEEEDHASEPPSRLHSESGEAPDFNSTRCPRCLRDFGNVERQQMHYLTDIDGCMANLARAAEEEEAKKQSASSAQASWNTGIFGSFKSAPKPSGFTFSAPTSAPPKIAFASAGAAPASDSAAGGSSFTHSFTAQPRAFPLPTSRRDIGKLLKEHSKEGWNSCGGNPEGEAHPSREDPSKCTDACRDCGARTHWTCCGDTNPRSRFCKVEPTPLPLPSVHSFTFPRLASPAGREEAGHRSFSMMPSPQTSTSADLQMDDEHPISPSSAFSFSARREAMRQSDGGFALPSYSSFAQHCPYFMAGYCRNGDQCNMSHGGAVSKTYSSLLRNMSSVSHNSDELERTSSNPYPDSYHEDECGPGPEDEPGREDEEGERGSEEDGSEGEDEDRRLRRILRTLRGRGAVHRPWREGRVLCFDIKVVSASSVARGGLEHGDKIVLHQGVLTAALAVEDAFPWPLAFRIKNNAQPDVPVMHAGVLDFSSGDEVAILPNWMMAELKLNDGDTVQLRAVNIPKGVFCQLQPQTRRWLDIPKDKRQGILEFRLRNFQTLTEKSCVNIHHEGQTYPFKVLQCRPAPAVSIIDCDLATDIVNPPDHVGNEEEEGEVAKIVYIGQTDVAASAPAGEFVQFTLRAPRGMETLPSVLRLSITAKSGDPDLYVSSLRAPDQSCYDLCAQGDGSVSLVLREGSLGWHPTVIRFSVASFTDASEFVIAAQSLLEASNGAAGSGSGTDPLYQQPGEGQDGSDAGPEETLPVPGPDEEVCKNCRKCIPKARMVMHERHCGRHMLRCEQPDCGVLMTQSAKRKHDLINHTELQCPCCPFRASQIPLHRHQLHDCKGRLVMCENPWCRMRVIASDQAEHMEACWMRSTICPLCFQDIRWRDMEGHLITSHAVDPTQVDFSDLMNIDRDNLPMLS